LPKVLGDIKEDCTAFELDKTGEGVLGTAGFVGSGCRIGTGVDVLL